MADKARVTKVVMSAIEELNADLDAEKRVPMKEDAVLAGNPSRLTSLDLVNLIVLVEEKLAGEFNVAVNLADEKAMSQRNSPFRNVPTFSEYIVKVLEEKGV